MKITLITRGPGLYSSQRLFKTIVGRGHTGTLLDYSRCSLVLSENALSIYYRDAKLEMPAGIIPRIGATMTSEGAALLRQFELLGVPTVTSSVGLIQARDKLTSLQLLSAHGVAVPVTVFAESMADMDTVLHKVGGFPCVLKPLESTHGIGVRLIDDWQDLDRAMEAAEITGQPIIIQEYIKEAEGKDIRAFVVDGQVVGSMQRVAKCDDFRSNLHQGGTAYKANMTDFGRALAIQAAQVLGLGVAGVDIIQSKRGPLVLEVNASPGLEGIERVTGADIAGEIVTYLEKLIQQKEP